MQPTFVYEQEINKVRIWVMEKIGFRTFYQWTANEFATFVASQGFSIVSKELIEGKPLPECILIAKPEKAMVTLREEINIPASFKKLLK